MKRKKSKLFSAFPQDFRTRIRKYELGYETIMDRALHYIKLIDMVTGRVRGAGGGGVWVGVGVGWG